MIVTLYVPPSLAAKQATHEIPIVAIVGDPVETGIVSSLARPGGNITGVSLMASALAGKSVELFRDMLPSLRRVGVLGHATNPVFAKAMLDEVLLAGGPTRTEIQPVVMVRGTDEFESAFTTFVRERADAVVVQGSLAIKPLTDMAINYRMPTASTTRAFVDIGGLMSFGADGPAAFRHGAKFVQRILQGKQPQDIPIEQPTKFELAINLKTAKAIGLKDSRYIRAARRRRARMTRPYLLRCMSPVVAHSVVLSQSCRGLLIGVKRTAMLRRGNACF